jgi:methionyl-tRNA formyltransferase
MIIKINKSLKELKIGIIGFRYFLLEEVLKEKNLAFDCLNDDNNNPIVSGKKITEEYDIIFATGVYNILPPEIIRKPQYGIYNFHETPLPEGKGHAPIQWTIENKRKNIVITFYEISEGVDDGKIACQYYVPVEKTDGYDVLEQKRQFGIKECFKKFLADLEQGIIVLRKQTGKGDYHGRRYPENSELNIDKSLRELWDDIRKCDNNKYPAFFKLGNKKIFLKYEIIDDDKRV